jgi:hypothetical protein
MLIWLIGVAIFILIWGKLWRVLPAAGFGVLVGLPLAWIASILITPYITGMQAIPVWLPPLPIITIAVTLFVFGVITWFRADKLSPPKDADADAHDDHGHGGGHH